MSQNKRAGVIRSIAEEAGTLAANYFAKREDLSVDVKGHQDFVSEADKQVELLIRKKIAAELPDDAIVGEEHAPTLGTSGFTWVIDPIDGTTNFLNGVPFWCVAIAGVSDGKTQIGVIRDPNHNETFVAERGKGAFVNKRSLRLTQQDITRGTIFVGSSRRTPPGQVAQFIDVLLQNGGIFARTGSGALGLAYVAAGRYIGYVENYMNAWDCLAGQLLCEEAGGVVEQQDANDIIANGGRVITSAPGVFEPLSEIYKASFGS